jgi:uncharacterized protein YjgD (DUF1641 family)
MEDKELKIQVAELNEKVDLLLDYVNQQRLKTNQLEDLVSDLSIVGKDFYDTAVDELDNQMIDIDPDQVKCLILRILRNIENMNRFLEIFESMNDLLIDAAPIFNEVVIDFSKKMDEFEKRGYFETLKTATSPEVLGAIDKGVNAFKNVNSEEIPRYSLFKVIREINKPEMKYAMGFMMTFLKALATETNNKK